MFVYVGIAIGYFPSFVHNRFLLGLSGIAVVIASLIISIGITLFLDIPLSMISAEVVPFLLLAIGVDNMFIIVRAEKEVSNHLAIKVEEWVALALKEVGPSVFTAAFCESLAFFIGILTGVPALVSFCLVSGIGVLVDFLLQITVFTAALTLDAKWIEQNRADLFPCIWVKVKKEPWKAYVREAFQNYFVPFLFTKKAEICTYIFAVVFFVFGILACI